MGLLDRWTKKTTTEQLKNDEKAKPTVSKGSKVVKKTAPAAEAVFEKKNGKEVKHDSIAHRVLLRALVTEKSAIAESHNKYSFVVERFATKYEVKKAIADAYGVVPAAVHMLNYNGKRVRFGRSMGRRSDYKKAVVTLPAGKTIDLHEGV